MTILIPETFTCTADILYVMYDYTNVSWKYLHDFVS